MADENNNTAVKSRRLLLIGAGALTLLVVTLLNLRGLEKNLIYYLDAKELQDRGQKGQGGTVRLGGLVQKNSVKWDAQRLALSFRVGLADTGEPNILVQATGAPPQMFQEGIGAVVEGQYDGQAFHADRVMVKHSNEYRPPAEGERPEDAMGTLEASVNNAPRALPRATKADGQAQPGQTKYE